MPPAATSARTLSTHLVVCAATFLCLTLLLWWSASCGSEHPIGEEPSPSTAPLHRQKNMDENSPQLDDTARMRHALANKGSVDGGDPYILDCDLDPCDWWQSKQFLGPAARINVDSGLRLHDQQNHEPNYNALEPLLASEYEAAARPRQVHPQLNRHRCQSSSRLALSKPPRRTASSYRDHPCAVGDITGYSQLYDYRHAYRRAWDDDFEFDGTPGVYNDLGVASPFVPATQRPGTTNSGSNHDKQAQPRRGEYQRNIVRDWCDPTEPVLNMAAIKKGYGLTNQLLSLAGQFALAGRTNRVIAVDASERKMRIPIRKLLNLSRSSLPSSVPGVVWYCNHTTPAVMHKVIAPHSLQAIDRKQVALRPHKVMALFDKGFTHVQHRPLAFIHELYLRYPFEQERDPELLPASLFCGFQFVDWISRLGGVVVRALRFPLGQQRGPPQPFAAWHLRLETSDGVAMRKGRAPTTPDHIQRFLDRSLLPLLRRRRIRRVLLCAGPLPAAILEAVATVGAREGIEFVSKFALLPPGTTFDDFGTAGNVRERTGDYWTSPTATDAAAVDVVAMERADLVVLTTTSSLTALLYAKRCGGVLAAFHQSRSRTELVLEARRRGCSMSGAVYLYDTYLDGSLTSLLHYPCGYQYHAYLPAPPGLVPRAPGELDVFAFRFRPDSPLFAEEAWRNAPAPGSTAVPFEQP